MLPTALAPARTVGATVLVGAALTAPAAADAQFGKLLKRAAGAGGAVASQTASAAQGALSSGNERGLRVPRPMAPPPRASPRIDLRPAPDLTRHATRSSRAA